VFNFLTCIKHLGQTTSTDLKRPQSRKTSTKTKKTSKVNPNIEKKHNVARGLQKTNDEIEHGNTALFDLRW